jgi:metal-responsive CopG/Arc/MetJ family transcriptional regulator
MKDTTSLGPASRYDVVGAVRLNISMAQPLLPRLDAAARSGGFTRSGFIAQAVREKLEKVMLAA